MGFLGERSLTRRRFGATTWTDGRASAGSSTDSTFLGSVQPLTGKDRQVLPQGLRQRFGRKVYCPIGTLLTDEQADGGKGDQVVIDSEVFAVTHVDSDHPLIEHDRVFLLRVQESE